MRQEPQLSFPPLTHLWDRWPMSTWSSCALGKEGDLKQCQLDPFAELKVYYIVPEQSWFPEVVGTLPAWKKCPCLLPGPSLPLPEPSPLVLSSKSNFKQEACTPTSLSRCEAGCSHFRREKPEDGALPSDLSWVPSLLLMLTRRAWRKRNWGERLQASHGSFCLFGF